MLCSLENHYQEFLRDSQDAQSFQPDDRLQVERDYNACTHKYELLLRSQEKGERPLSAFSEGWMSPGFPRVLGIRSMMWADTHRGQLLRVDTPMDTPTCTIPPHGHPHGCVTWSPPCSAALSPRVLPTPRTPIAPLAHIRAALGYLCGAELPQCPPSSHWLLGSPQC